MLLDIAAEALKSDGVLLSVHLLAANDRCAAQVRGQPSFAVMPLAVCRAEMKWSPESGFMQ